MAPASRHAACLLAFALVTQAQAHPFLEPYALPLPLTHYLVGAGATVLLAFLGSMWLRRRPTPPRTMRLRLPTVPTAVAIRVLRTLSVLSFAALLGIGFFGAQGDWDSNFLPLAVWVAWWVGLAFVCALLGDAWVLIDPWRSVGLATAWLTRRLRGPRPPPLGLPEAVGVWPAVVLFLAFAWVLFVWPSNAVPARLAGAVLAYSVLAWTCMALFGVRAWLGRMDPFALYFALFGRFAPLGAERDEQGRPALVLRPYGAGLARADLPSWSEAAFVLTVLAALGFGGFVETQGWSRFMGAGVEWLYRAGVVERFGFVAAQSAVKTVGLLVSPWLFAAVYLATCTLCGRLGGRAMGAVARGHALSLVPIAIGVHLAHDFAVLAAQGQMIAPVGSDPLGFGWDLFGASGRTPDPAQVHMGRVWAVAVAGVVLGHAAAVWLAHRASTRLSLGPVAQMPMAALMVAYTVSSLWVLAQPIVL